MKEWNCFNLVDTCKNTLILFLKCDVTKFRIPPQPLVTQCHTLSTPSAPLNVRRNLRMSPYFVTIFTSRVFSSSKLALTKLVLILSSIFTTG